MNLAVETESGNGYDCGICTETKAVYDSFGTGGCSHIYCIGCTVNYIVSKLDDNVSSIKCPEPSCEAVLDPEFCRGPCSTGGGKRSANPLFSARRNSIVLTKIARLC
ncbi:hypothetical protein V6N13_095009 [Hibiscus sabdariffa]